MNWKQSILVTTVALGICGAAGATTVLPSSMDSTAGSTSSDGSNRDVTTTLSMPGFSLNLIGYSSTDSVPTVPTIPTAASGTGNGFGPISLSYYFPLTLGGSGTSALPLNIQIGQNGSGMLSIDTSRGGQSLFSLVLPNGSGTISGGAGSGSSTSTGGGTTVSPVPLPAAVWLFGSGLIGLVAVSRRSSVRLRPSAV